MIRPFVGLQPVLTAHTSTLEVNTCYPSVRVRAENRKHIPLLLGSCQGLLTSLEYDPSFCLVHRTLHLTACCLAPYCPFHHTMSSLLHMLLQDQLHFRALCDFLLEPSASSCLTPTLLFHGSQCLVLRGTFLSYIISALLSFIYLYSTYHYPALLQICALGWFPDLSQCKNVNSQEQELCFVCGCMPGCYSRETPAT